MPRFDIEMKVGKTVLHNFHGPNTLRHSAEFVAAIAGNLLVAAKFRKTVEPTPDAGWRAANEEHFPPELRNEHAGLAARQRTRGPRGWIIGFPPERVSAAACGKRTERAGGPPARAYRRAQIHHRLSVIGNAVSGRMRLGKGP